MLMLLSFTDCLIEEILLNFVKTRFDHVLFALRLTFVCVKNIVTMLHECDAT